MTDRLFRVEKISDFNTLETIREDWNALLENTETQTVELTYEWQITYWRHFNDEAELFILVIRDARRIVAIAPLKLVNKWVMGAKIRCLEIIAAQESNYQDLIIGNNQEEILESVMDYLVINKRAWDMLSLKHIPETSATAHFLLDRLNDHPFSWLLENEKCAYLEIDTSWEEHKKGLGKDRRHRMKNRMKRIERDLGNIQLRTCSTEDQFKSALPEFFELHRKRWNQTNTPSQFMDRRYCDFYFEAGLALLQKKQVGLSALEAGGRTLAQLLFFTFEKSSLIQLIAYDPDFYPYSPMVVLQELFVEESLSNGIDLIDWGTYYAWKELWANRIKNRVNIYIYPKRLLPQSIYIITRLFKAFLAYLRQNPRVLNYVKYLRDRLRVKKTSQVDTE